MVNLWTSGQVVKDLSLCATAGLEGGSDQACLLTENSSGGVRHMIQLYVCGFSFIKLFVLNVAKLHVGGLIFLNCATLLWSVGYICLFAMVLFRLVCEFTFSLTCCGSYYTCTCGGILNVDLKCTCRRTRTSRQFEKHFLVVHQ